MQFALPLPWWVLLLLIASLVATAWFTYAGVIVRLAPERRRALVGLRAMTLLLLVACLLRPVRVMPPAHPTDAILPILVDASRSMRLADAGGVSRIERARQIVAELQPELDAHFRPELWMFGAGLTQPTSDAPIAPNAERSDLSGALRELREQYRNQPMAGVVVISDGGDTGAQDAAAVVADGGIPVYAIGVGSPRAAMDLEVVDVVAGDAAVADSSVDLTVTAVSRGAAAPFDVRILENGRPIDIRRVTPSPGGGPVRAVIQVSPPRETATLYTVEIPSASNEVTLDNNRRSVLVEPPERRRRLLFIEGAPGFEHTFLKRALMLDPGLEVDSVVRKGRDTEGDATYVVQSVADRAPQLATGFPESRPALYLYDAVVLANVDPDALTRVQLEMLAAFVGERGGGLLVLGARSFVAQGLVRTPLDEVLPVDLADRGAGVMRAAATHGERFRVWLTDEGQAHPVMRIAATPGDVAKRWAAVPALTGAATLGAPRPGAQVLAMVRAEDGPRPLVAVQRFGRGRSMVFTGEASWRWRMQMPSTDRTYELFWRQAARWLSSASPGQVGIADVAGLMPGETAAITLDVRDDEYAPAADAQVDVRVTLPGGETRPLRVATIDGESGRQAGDWRFTEPGIYKVSATARQGSTTLGTAERWILVGGADAEMADPRLNEDVLRRVARASGGRYLAAADARQVQALLAAREAAPAAPQLRELWHSPWVFCAAVLLLAVEWTLRRRWGLR